MNPTRLHPLALGVVLLLLAACASAPSHVSPTGASTASAAQVAIESQRLNDWFERKYEEQLRFSPMQLTVLGRKDLHDQLDDVSIEAAEKQLRWQKASVREMHAKFHYDLLDEETRLSWDIWEYQYKIAAAGEPYLANDYVFDQMNGAQSALPTFLINFHAVDTEADMQAYIQRVQQVPRFMDQLLARAQAAAKRGIRPPRFAFEGVIEQARKVIGGAPFEDGADSPLWADMQAKIEALITEGAATPSGAEELKQVARDALVGALLPAYRKLISWEQQDMANAPLNATGVGSTQPNGKAYYHYKLAQQTTTQLDADRIHQLGLDEVARLRGEMEALKDQVGFTGDLPAFFHFIDTDPRFKYPNTDAGRQAYLDAATAAINNIRKQLPKYFGLLPRADLVVKRVEPYREQPGAAQHYMQGTPDGSRPGTYYVHLIDMNSMPIDELEDVAYHEGIPGHHLQISIAQEHEGIPTFRQQAGFTAYTEGWGLYAEWLAKEMPGTYQDPYSDFGRLVGEMWRAVRLVVDTGLHAKGWTEQQAFEYFKANTPIPDAAARSEVRRYLILPGQACSYKVGMLKIQELRHRAERALGNRFDIRAFHDVVLGGGALPLDLLEQRVDRWIAQQSAAQ